MFSNPTNLAVTRLRHPLKFRMLQVKRVVPISAHLICVSFTADDMEEFVSNSFDDHIKVFFPEPGADKPVLPKLGPDGPIFPIAHPRPIARDLTPRRFNPSTRELDIEFSLHEAGPAANWAAQAEVGQYLGMGGPRGSFVIPTSFDWHLLIGDDSALPAIGRRLEELPVGTRVTAIIEVYDASACIKFDTKAQLSIVWCYRIESRFPGDALLQAVRQYQLPLDDEIFIWAAGESAVMQKIRSYFCAERGVDKTRIRAASYWKHGAQAVHETLEN